MEQQEFRFNNSSSESFLLSIFVNAFGFSADYSMDGSFSLEAKH